jgi:aminopeptidase N
MYPKSGNMLHAIRHGLNNDSLFRQILRGLNKTFYHKTVSAPQIENYISQKAGFDYKKVFEQYLTTVQIPKLEFYTSTDGNKVFYRYSNCVDGFNMPLTLKDDKAIVKIVPSTSWKSLAIKENQGSLFDKVAIEKMYYVTAEKVEKQ